MFSHRIPTTTHVTCDECDHRWGIHSEDEGNLDHFHCPKCGLALRPQQTHPELYAEENE